MLRYCGRYLASEPRPSLAVSRFVRPIMGPTGAASRLQEEPDPGRRGWWLQAGKMRSAAGNRCPGPSAL